MVKYELLNFDVRGKHAHRKLERITICTSGACDFMLDNGKENTALKMYAKGASISAIAREIGVSNPTVSKFLSAQK